MKTALQIVFAALALGLVQPEAALAGKAQQIDFLTKNTLKTACNNSGGDFSDHGEIYQCHTDNSEVSCDGTSGECYGEMKTMKMKSSAGSKTQGGLAKPKAVLKPKALLKPKAVLKPLR